MHGNGKSFKNDSPIAVNGDLITSHEYDMPVWKTLTIFDILLH